MFSSSQRHSYERKKLQRKNPISSAMYVLECKDMSHVRCESYDARDE
jgi:hypothetical protein